MKKKTIQKVIDQKFNAWIETISDDEVKKLVKKNTIITGGCIASMLLKDKVNDFDVYFTDKETVLSVTRYYVNKFKEAHTAKHGDGKEILIEVREQDDRVKIFIKSAGIASETSGSNYEYFESRPDEESDDYIQQVVNDVEKMDEKEIFIPDDKKFRPVFISANSITLSDRIQIVTRFFGAPDHIHLHYDYVHCTNYWLSADGKLYLKQDALEALMAKELIYIGSKYPICSVIRSRKFIKRGFTVNAGQYLKMAFQISQLDLTNLETLEDQLIGVDVAYFYQLIEGLKTHKENNPDFQLSYGYLATIIDKIF